MLFRSATSLKLAKFSGTERTAGLGRGLPDPCMQFAKVCLFADDAKLYKHVTSREDHQSLQNGLNALQEWSNRWLLKLNISKCKTVFFAEILTTNITIISHQLS